MCPIEEKVKENLSDIQKQLDSVHHSIEIINRILLSMHSTLNLNELSRNAKSLISELLNTNTFTLLIYDSTKNKFVFSCSNGIADCTLDHIIKTAQDNKSQWLANLGEKVSICPINTHDKNHYVFIPLERHNKMIGIAVLSDSSIVNLTNKHIDILSLIAVSFLFAYQNSYMYAMTKKMAIWDTKTNLYNHRYFLRALSSEICRARRYGRFLSLIAIDVDNFKKFNDKHGHIAGDKALLEISKIIKQNVRVIDIAARFGGDEFFLLLPETDIIGANIVSTRLIEAVSKHSFLNKKKHIRLTISCGIATLRDGMTAKELLVAADTDLLKNKKKNEKGKSFNCT